MDDSSEMRESQLRSIAKALTYRLTGTLTTIGLTFAVTGEAAVALAVGSVEPVLKILVYYLHERVWQRVPIGTIRRLAVLIAMPRRYLNRRRSGIA